MNDRVSGDEPLPARSIERIENVYEPAASPLYVVGDEQLAYAPVAVPGPSSLHSNVPSSFELNSNDAVVACVVPDGPLKIAAIGGSLVDRPVAGEPVARLVPRRVRDEDEGVGLGNPGRAGRTSSAKRTARSSKARNLVNAELTPERRVRLGRVELQSRARIVRKRLAEQASKITPGATVSTVNGRVAGVGSVIPERVARTENVYRPSGERAVRLRRRATRVACPSPRRPVELALERRARAAST